MRFVDLLIVVVALIIIAVILFLILRDRSTKPGDSCKTQSCGGGYYCSSMEICEKGSGMSNGEGCTDRCVLGLFCVRGICSQSQTPEDVPLYSFTNSKIMSKGKYLSISCGDLGEESYWSDSDTGQKFSYSSSRQELSVDGDSLYVNSRGLLVRGNPSKILITSGSNILMRDTYNNVLGIGQGQIQGTALFNAPNYEKIQKNQQSLESPIIIKQE